MPDYKTMYKELFIAVTKAIDILKNAQIKTEEIYISSSEEDENKIIPFKILNENTPPETQNSEK